MSPPIARSTASDASRRDPKQACGRRVPPTDAWTPPRSPCNRPRCPPARPRRPGTGPDRRPGGRRRPGSPPMTACPLVHILGAHPHLRHHQPRTGEPGRSGLRTTGKDDSPTAPRQHPQQLGGSVEGAEPGLLHRHQPVQGTVFLGWITLRSHQPRDVRPPPPCMVSHTASGSSPRTHARQTRPWASAVSISTPSTSHSTAAANAPLLPPVAPHHPIADPQNAAGPAVRQALQRAKEWPVSSS